MIVFLEELHGKLWPVLFASGAVEQIFGFYVAGIGPNCAVMLANSNVVRRLLAGSWESCSAQQNEDRDKSPEN